MSHASPAATAVPAGPPACLGASPPLAGKHRGNPDLGLSPRCGARTRGGCPCRAPAIHGKLRCRMHGGRSTGPRTEEGMARLRTARTVHGGYGAEMRARNRYSLTELRRGEAGNAAVRCVDRLPPEFSARLSEMPPELKPPPRPTGGLTPAEDRAMLRAEAEALAPWRQAIARAGQAGARRAAPPRTVRQNPMHQNPPPTGATSARARGAPWPAARSSGRQNPMHQSASAVRAMPLWLRHLARRWAHRQEPIHQNPPPTGAASGRSRRALRPAARSKVGRSPCTRVRGRHG